ncbi:single-stranded DNA-binding protein [Candidatus Gracilibacteria bacterium]|nr:MAG: single-stranded DNA-binding protein [Candidatus Gracilibacteria bacterium]
MEYKKSFKFNLINMKELQIIQEKLNAPKNLRNNFGNYNYRSAESILEAVKPLLKETECILKLTDELVNIGERYYIKSIAILKNKDGQTEEAIGYAREEEQKKGMDGSQITGASSSYARKYALNGLFAIDDGKDSDATNTHGTDDGKKAQNNTKQKTSTSQKWYNDVDKNIDNWTDLIAEGKTTPETIIKRIKEQGFSLSKVNENKILELKN